MKNKKIAVFDWNGTLFDDTDLAVSCSNHVLEHFGRPSIDKEKLRANYDMPISVYYEKLGLKAEEMQKDPQKIVDLYIEVYEAQSESAGLMAGAKDLLAQLSESGAASVVLSNYLREHIQKRIEMLGITTFFSEILAYDGAKNQAHNVMARTNRVSKGQKLASHIEAYGIDPRNVIIVGDTPEEMEIAREVGTLSLALAAGYASVSRLEAAKPDYLVHKFCEMEPIFRAQGFL